MAHGCGGIPPRKRPLPRHPGAAVRLARLSDLSSKRGVAVGADSGAMRNAAGGVVADPFSQARSWRLSRQERRSMNYEWDFSFVLQNYPEILKGVGVTFIYSIATIVAGLLIGIVVGLVLIRRSDVLTYLASGYVQLFRCTPLLIQVIWFFYALPVLLNINLPPWLAAGLGLTLYMGAFSAEIVRAGINSIEKGQWQAARALGMSESRMMRRIILPQAVRRMLPPLVNQSVLQLKNTSLLYIVAVPDLMYVGSTLVSNTFRPLEVYTTVAIIYLVILYPLQKMARWFERHENA
jgi:polar amino acid transport system permease protein